LWFGNGLPGAAVIPFLIVDHGHRISPFTGMRELGHRSLTLIEKTYGHLLDTLDRSPVVAYRETTVVEIHSVAESAYSDGEADDRNAGA
jgi:hypothetical protein